MKTRFRCNDDDSTQDGRKTTDAEILETIRQTITDEGPIILEHWFYLGSCAPGGGPRGSGVFSQNAK